MNRKTDGIPKSITHSHRWGFDPMANSYVCLDCGAKKSTLEFRPAKKKKDAVRSGREKLRW